MTTNLGPWPGNMYPPVRAHATANITPFTYYDGLSFLEVLEALRAWLRETLVPGLDGIIEIVDGMIQDALENVEIDLEVMRQELNDALASIELTDTELRAYVDDVLQQVINNSIELQDAVLAGLIADEESQSRGELDTAIGDYVNDNVSDIAQQGLRFVIVGNPKYGESDPTGVVSSQSAVEAAIADAIARPQGSRIIYVDGVYTLTDPILIEQSDVQVIGVGAADENGTSGSGFIAHADHVGGTMFEMTGARSRVSGLSFRGGERVEIALGVSGFSSRVERTYAHGGTLYAGEIIGNRGSLHNNYWRGVTAGEAAVRVSGADVQVVGDRVRADGARAGANSALSGGQWTGGHITGGGFDTEVLLEATSVDTVYSGIYFDTVNAGPMVHLVATSTRMGNRFTGCLFYNRSKNMPDGVHPVFKLDATAGSIKSTIITGCYFNFDFNRRPSYIIESLGNVNGTSFTSSNVITPTPLWNARPTMVSGIVRSQDASINAFRSSEIRGTNEFDGTGTKTVFEVDYPGLSASPDMPTLAVVVSPGSVAAAAPHYVQYTTTNRVRVTYLQAPPSGTGNVVINWAAWI